MKYTFHYQAEVHCRGCYFQKRGHLFSITILLLNVNIIDPCKTAYSTERGECKEEWQRCDKGVKTAWIVDVNVCSSLDLSASVNPSMGPLCLWQCWSKTERSWEWMYDKTRWEIRWKSIHVLEKGKVRAARARMTTKTFQQGWNRIHWFESLHLAEL